MEEKVIYEYFYRIGDNHFESVFELIVDKETDKMLYGVAVAGKNREYNWGRFSVHKDKLNKTKKVKRNNESLLRVQVEANSKEEADTKAGQCLGDYLTEMAQRVFKMIEK